MPKVDSRDVVAIAVHDRRLSDAALDNELPRVPTWNHLENITPLRKRHAAKNEVDLGGQRRVLVRTHAPRFVVGDEAIRMKRAATQMRLAVVEFDAERLGVALWNADVDLARPAAAGFRTQRSCPCNVVAAIEQRRLTRRAESGFMVGISKGV